MFKVLLAEIRSIDTSRKALRSFGLVVGGVLIAIAAIVFWRADWTLVPAVRILGGIGGALVVLGLISPLVLKPVHKVWMALAVLLGYIMTRVLLTLVYFIAVTPIGLLMKALGKDLLNRKLDREAESYWIPKSYLDRSPKRLEKYY